MDMKAAGEATVSRRVHLMHGGELWAQHPHVRTGSDLKFRERAADALKAAFGTWTLLGAIIAAIFLWLAFVKDPGELHLNLGLSFVASVQGVVLQIAANRGDRINAEVAKGTYENSQKMLTIEQQLLEMQQTQMEILTALHARPAARGARKPPVSTS